MRKGLSLKLFLFFALLGETFVEDKSEEGALLSGGFDGIMISKSCRWEIEYWLQCLCMLTARGGGGLMGIVLGDFVSENELSPLSLSPRVAGLWFGDSNGFDL